jgi:hypothetical protein
MPPRLRPRRRLDEYGEVVLPDDRGLGPLSGGQSGDVQGLSSAAFADSESVRELEEEGQAYEAEVISGVESADNADESEVTSHQIREEEQNQS